MHRKKRLNNYGYTLVEIILSFAITFLLVYFLMELVIKIKNKNDDLLVETVGMTDRNIITNKLMEYIVDDPASFDCDKLKVEGQIVKYDDENISVVDDYISVNNKVCTNNDGNIKIKIPMDVKQLPDKKLDVSINYIYGNGSVCAFKNDMVYSYKCKNPDGTDKIFGSEPYDFVYTGVCEVVDDNDNEITELDLCNSNWKIRLLTDGMFNFVDLKTTSVGVDIFIVGGGGNGGSGSDYKAQHSSGGGSGGGGAAVTVTNFLAQSNVKYKIDIGNASENSSFGIETLPYYTALSGKSGSVSTLVSSNWQVNYGLGGSGRLETENDNYGAAGVIGVAGSSGNGKKGIYEFNGTSGKLYGASGGFGGGGDSINTAEGRGDGSPGGLDGGGEGGGGCNRWHDGDKYVNSGGYNGDSATNNSGSGGGGGGGACGSDSTSYGSKGSGGTGGSGIVIIRNTR